MNLCVSSVKFPGAHSAVTYGMSVITHNRGVDIVAIVNVSNEPHREDPQGIRVFLGWITPLPLNESRFRRPGGAGHLIIT